MKKKRITNQLAREFGAELVREIGKENVAEANRINQENLGEPWCASHDYCDANEVMLAAFKKVFGREANTPDDYEAMNDAWDIAKANGFFLQS